MTLVRQQTQKTAGTETGASGRCTRSVVLFMTLTLAGSGLLALIAFLDVSYRYRQDIVITEQAPARKVAIVFGAGIYPGGRLSSVLADRMYTAVNLYKSGVVQKLLLSGDNSTMDYNEPARMGEFAHRLGVPESALAYDYAGRRTYDSCWHARHIFGQDQVILVTQSFHLPRALYICRQLGIDAVGVPAEQRPYRLSAWFSFREAFARIVAWFDVHILRPQPIGGSSIDLFASADKDGI